MIPPVVSALDRLRIVLRHRDEGAEGSTTIPAAPLEQRYAAGIGFHRHTRLNAVAAETAVHHYSRCEGGLKQGERLRGQRCRRPEFRHAAPYRFVGNVEPTLGEQILHVSLAEREAQVEPHSVLDDNRWKALAAV
jgi:hypothetical protein